LTGEAGIAIEGGEFSTGPWTRNEMIVTAHYSETQRWGAASALVLSCGLPILTTTTMCTKKVLREA
jgi:hypothetical protein